jgi:hypothetical protein
MGWVHIGYAHRIMLLHTTIEDNSEHSASVSFSRSCCSFRRFPLSNRASRLRGLTLYRYCISRLLNAHETLHDFTPKDILPSNNSLIIEMTFRPPALHLPYAIPLITRTSQPGQPGASMDGLNLFARR